MDDPYEQSTIIAKYTATEFTARDASKPLQVALTIGPTDIMGGLSLDVNDPRYLAVAVDELRKVYRQQARAFVKAVLIYG